MKRIKLSAFIAWLLFGFVAASVVAGLIFDYSANPTAAAPVLGELLLPLVQLAFAFVGALIIQSRPRNAIGLLMMLPGLSLVTLVDGYFRPFVNGMKPVPTLPSPLFLLGLWFSGWNWLLLVFPLLFIILLFPSGRPLSRRWGWLIYVGLAPALLIFVTGIISNTLTVGNGTADWSFPNPIGFVDLQTLVDSPLFTLFQVILPIWVVLCVASLFVRFRRAEQVERQQIKWLFFAGLLFAFSYVPTFVAASFTEPQSVWNVFWLLGMLAIPAAVGIAILRYRLFDIDLVIRKTLQYAVLSVLLALVYFGSVVLLQSLIERATDAQSPLVIVVSTLIIAALFAPLRQRVQTAVDRRFYRQKYDAQQILAQFAQTARDETDMEVLTAELTRVVQDTMQPEGVSVWLPPVGRRSG